MAQGLKIQRMTAPPVVAGATSTPVKQPIVSSSGLKIERMTPSSSSLSIPRMTSAPAPEILVPQIKSPGLFSKIGNFFEPPAEGSPQSKTILGQLPSTLAENLPFGVGGIVKTLRQEPEITNYWTPKDLITGGIETAKDYLVKYPAMVVSNLAGKPVKFDIPGIGEVSNRQFNTAERIKNGEDPNAVLLEEGSGAIFDTLFLFAMGQKIFGERHVVITKGKAPGITPKQPPKSLRLYESPTASQALSPELVKKMALEKGVDLGPNYNPTLPTYFRLRTTPTGKVIPEVAQIKPSYFKTFTNILKGKAEKVPENQVNSIIKAETSIKAIEQAKPIIPPPIPVVPPTSPIPKPPTAPQTPTTPPTPAIPPETLKIERMTGPKPEVIRETPIKQPEAPKITPEYTKGETLTFTPKAGGTPQEAQFVSLHERGIMATEPRFDVPVLYPTDKYDVSRPSATKTQFRKGPSNETLPKEYEKNLAEVERIKQGKVSDPIKDGAKLSTIENLPNTERPMDVLLNYENYKNIVSKHGDFDSRDIILTANKYDQGIYIKKNFASPEKINLIKQNKDGGIFVLGANRFNGYGVVTFFEQYNPKQAQQYLASIKTRGKLFDSKEGGGSSSIAQGERVPASLSGVKESDKASIHKDESKAKVLQKKEREQSAQEIADEIADKIGWGGGEASIGSFADGTPIKAGGIDSIQPIEMPELVEIAKEILKVPKITEKTKRIFGGLARGVFDPNKGEIRLHPDIFKDPVQAAKTLAHEIGHLIDWLPDQTLKRGNLLGRLLTLREFYKSVFDKALSQGTTASAMEDKVKQQYQVEIKQAEEVLSKKLADHPKFQEWLNDLAMEMEMSEPGYRLQNPETGEWRGVSSTFPKWMPEELRSKELFNGALTGINDAMEGKIRYPSGRSQRERDVFDNLMKQLDAQLDTDTSAERQKIMELYEQKKERIDTLRKTFSAETIKNSDIRQELQDVSGYWRPYNFSIPDNSNYGKYRRQGKELYADAISMLFNSPGLLEEKAPTFYKEFFDNLDKKPLVRDAYFDLQARLNGDRQTIVNARREGVRGMFKEGDYKAAELQAAREAEYKARQRDIRFRLKYELVDNNQALIDRVRALEKKGINIPEDEDPRYYLEERNYMGGPQKAWLERHSVSIYRDLQRAGVSWTDFGEVLFYRRIASGDRSTQANPRGITPEAAKELLADMEKGWTKEQKDTVEKSVRILRGGVMDVNKEAYDVGMYSTELYDQMQENQDYTTFRVQDYLENALTSKIYKSIGTLKDITNPADATILKTLAIIRAIEYQKAKRSAIDLLQKYYPNEIKKADTRWTGKRKEFIESKKPYEDLVMLYDKNNKGQMEGYYVDPYIKSSLENDTVGGNNLAISTLRMMNSGVFRPLYIGFNPGFQAFNLIRDFTRFWKNIPKMTIGKAIKLYKNSDVFRVAKTRAFGIKPEKRDGVEVYSKKDLDALDTLIEMEEKGILSVTFNDLVFGEEAEDKQINAILRHSGIESFAKEKKAPLVMKPILKLLDFIKRTGDLIETLPKVAGYYEFTKGGTQPITKKQASFIRKNVGSPDFLAGGHVKPATNEIFLFSNAITQGIRSDYNVAIKNPETRSGYWWKTAKWNLTPKILMFLASIGVFGAELKKMMEDASEYDKTNYTVVPIGTDQNNKTIYLRIPHDETGRLLGGLFWKALNVPANHQDIGKDITDIISVTGGQIPSLNPLLQDISATKQFLSGQNPYDYFRGRNILPEDVYKAGGSEATKQFLGWLFNQNGGSIFYKFYNEPTVPTPKSGAEKMFNFPVVGNILGRFVRVSDYGVRETLNQVKKEAQAEDAQRRLDENALVQKYTKEFQGGGKTEGELIRAMLNERFAGKSPTSREEADARERLVDKLREGIKKGGSDQNVQALFSATSNNEKKAIIRYLKENLSKEEFTQFRQGALKAKATTPEVFYEAEH